MTGISFQIAIGRFGGVDINISSFSWRICLGWVAFTLFFCDMEELIMKIVDENKRLNHAIH